MRLPILFFALFLAAPVWAVEFTVNSTVDAVDANPGDGICADAAGECTLRAAVMETNALPGADVVHLPAGTYRLSIPRQYTTELTAATGDLDVTDDLSLLGETPGTTTIDAAGLDSVFRLDGGHVLITNVTITGGGGVAGWGLLVFGATLQLVNARVTGNEAGIYAAYFASTLLLYSEVTQNRGGHGAGGIVDYFSSLRVEGSLIAGNEGLVGGISSEAYVEVCGRGGCSPICLDAPVSVVNSTITGNRAVSVADVTPVFGPAGGIAVGYPLSDRGCGGPLHLVNSTVTGNEGGGVWAAAPVFLRNSIVANQASGPNCFGSASYVSNGFNLDSDGTCGLAAASDKPSTDPMLGPLQNNGGPTRSQALLPGSPAIDAIPVASCTYDDDGEPGTPEVAVSHDQRGVERPQLGACDIGAYEVTQCGDGINNDSDAFTDLADLGCRDAASVTESPQCQDGIDNDPKNADGIDFDGGVSVLGYAAGPPDPQCVGQPWKNTEACGLGFELALILPGLMWVRRRVRKTA